MSVLRGIPGTGSCGDAPGINSCPGAPNLLGTVTKLSSTNDELLNGAQRVSKWEHQESSMPA